MTAQALMVTVCLATSAMPLQDAKPPAGETPVRVKSIDELKGLIKAKQVVVVDTRGEHEFALGHLPGALHIPRTQVAARVKELRQEKRPIVLYCACAQDAGAFRVAEQMAGLGVSNLSVLRGGWDGWVIRGELIEK